jgi:hypothetical protein|nr:MAG TPA: hypothetical protein [Caudoviricetes sp.]
MTREEKNLHMLSRKFYKMCNEFNCTLQGVSINSSLEGFESFIVSMKVNDNEFDVLVTFDELENEWLYTNTNKHTISNKGIEKKTIIGFCRYIVIDIINLNKTIEENIKANEEANEKHYDDYTSEDFISVKVAPLPEQQTSEESIKDTVIADDTIAYQNARVKETKPTVLNVMQCMMCPADRQGNRCGGEQWCKQTWKRYDAIVNPEWHHVSLATLANIDIDMLDEKRRNYMYLYNLIKDFRNYAFEIIRKDVYFETTSNVFRNIQQLYFNNVISFTTYDYAVKHIQVVGVEKGWFDSKSEETFGYKESRRYKVTLR